MKETTALAAILILTSAALAATARQATEDRLQRAGAVLHEIMAAPDNGIPDEFWNMQSALPLCLTC
jgi:hypothetical protein